MKPLTVIYGGGEFASCIATYLFHAALPVAMVVHPHQVYLRRPISLGEALNLGRKRIDEVEAVVVAPEILERFPEGNWEEKWAKAIHFYTTDRKIPVFSVEDFPGFSTVLQPQFLILSEMVPAAEDWVREIPVTIALHPGMEGELDYSFRIETQWNYRLGKEFRPESGEITDKFDLHFFKKPFSTVATPIAGTFVALKKIGDRVRTNEPLGTVDGIEIRSPYEGQIWGMFPAGRLISARAALALIYQGKSGDEYLDFGFDHRAVAGTVLKIVLQQSSF